MPFPQQNKEYTIDDIYALPDGQRAELIDGQMYMMAPPTRRHQQILGALYRKIADYIDRKGSSCEVDIAPFAGDRIETLDRFLKTSFEEAMMIPLSGAVRNELAEVILRYIEFHSESSVNVKSLQVLRELFR